VDVFSVPTSEDLKSIKNSLGGDDLPFRHDGAIFKTPQLNREMRSAGDAARRAPAHQPRKLRKLSTSCITRFTEF
jgi:hypothetical protein